MTEKTMAEMGNGTAKAIKKAAAGLGKDETEAALNAWSDGDHLQMRKDCTTPP